MTCYKPLDGWLYYDPEVGKRQVGFGKHPNWDTAKLISVPCGRCIGCRLDKSAEWASRLMHEAEMHEKNCFVTLTYNDEHLPSSYSLKKKDFQDFMKRLRKRIGKVRYYHCGEYGDTHKRPHYHAILFGFDFSKDRRQVEDSVSGHAQYESDLLNDCWGNGLTRISEVTYDSCAYVARYTLKKLVHEWDENDPREKEYSTCSRGIGKAWLEKWGVNAVYDADQVIFKERAMKPPAYYDKVLEKLDPALHREVKRSRSKGAESMKWHEDRTTRRLAAQERARLKQTQQKRGM